MPFREGIPRILRKLFGEGACVHLALLAKYLREGFLQSLFHLMPSTDDRLCRAAELDFKTKPLTSHDTVSYFFSMYDSISYTAVSLCHNRFYIDPPLLASSVLLTRRASEPQSSYETTS